MEEAKETSVLAQRSAGCLRMAAWVRNLVTRVLEAGNSARHAGPEGLMSAAAYTGAVRWRLE